MNCPICIELSSYCFTKKDVIYYECINCKSVFVPMGISQKDMVGGGNEVQRNSIQNTDRINRFIRLIGGHCTILDYGCGHGMLVDDCKSVGLNADGYDLYNPDFSLDKIVSRKYKLVSMIEVIEHTFYPFNELDEIYNLLEDGGVLYIETSFVDIAKNLDIELKDFFYIEPSVGHCTIFSHKGLDLLMESKGFKVIRPINDNVRLYKK